jgi:hypothetical protein
LVCTVASFDCAVTTNLTQKTDEFSVSIAQVDRELIYFLPELIEMPLQSELCIGEVQ